MKKGIVVSILCMVMGSLAYADDQETKSVDQEASLTDQKIKPVKLKRKCVKQNPLVAGQTDQALLKIYQQVCDKSNANQVNDLLAQAAMRMYELKQPMNALRLATELQQKNIHGSTLTDVTFLASVDIANDALQHMRSDEMRYLSTDLTYPPAKQLSENIRTALPAPVITTKAVEEAPKKEARTTSTANRRVASQPKTRTTSASRNTTQTAAPASRPTTTTPSAVRPTGTNPFASLKK
ncbi:hypothetical protein EXE30_02380 [Acinetobacter halotolerans]|uniref:Uncharacterized protein n=1 Tax=Acinetobacter halotolerans TaxID=1752076 RepID=A0A4Q6XCQ7_9GAMM|nr:hypothetical protein [Acinetobacter halotolerans]RZF55674.1 hypothetical protein EXE30_02380 [Acinetobacter halotolerans]